MGLQKPHLKPHPRQVGLDFMQNVVRQNVNLPLQTQPPAAPGPARGHQRIAHRARHTRWGADDDRDVIGRHPEPVDAHARPREAQTAGN